MDSPNQCAVVEVADLTGDYLNVCLLLVLYTLQARTKHHPWKGKVLVFKGMHNMQSITNMKVGKYCKAARPWGKQI